MTLRERMEAKRRAEADAKGGAPHPTNPPPAPEGVRGRLAPTTAVATAGDLDRRLESTAPDLLYGTVSEQPPGTLHQALTARASQMCVWLEPPPSTQAWLAARLEDSAQLVLILRLPLAYAPPSPNDRDIPF